MGWYVHPLPVPPHIFAQDEQAKLDRPEARFGWNPHVARSSACQCPGSSALVSGSGNTITGTSATTGDGGGSGLATMAGDVSGIGCARTAWVSNAAGAKIKISKAGRAGMAKFLPNTRERGSFNRPSPWQHGFPVPEQRRLLAKPFIGRQPCGKGQHRHPHAQCATGRVNQENLICRR